MKKYQTSKIVELNQYRSKIHPTIGHVVATLFPCNHKRYLGLSRMKGNEHHKRISYARVWSFIEYDIMDKHPCYVCPTGLIDLPDLTFVSDLVDTDSGLDIDDD